MIKSCREKIKNTLNWNVFMTNKVQQVRRPGLKPGGQLHQLCRLVEMYE